jgi:hypothetical protein
MTSPTQVHFAPGCFDTFDGTQEELDELITEIQSWGNGTNNLSFEVIEFGDLCDADPDVAEYYQDLADASQARRCH